MMSVTKPVSAKLWAWYIMRGLRPMSPRTRMATERSECWFRGRKALHAKNAMHSRRSACTASSCGYVTMSGPLQAAARICDRSRRHRVRRHPVIAAGAAPGRLPSCTRPPWRPLPLFAASHDRHSGRPPLGYRLIVQSAHLRPRCLGRGRAHLLSRQALEIIMSHCRCMHLQVQLVC